MNDSEINYRNTSKVETKSLLLSICIGIISIPILLVLVFPLTNVITEIIIKLSGIQLFTLKLLFDAIITFLILLIFFNSFFIIKKIYASSILLFLGLFMFVFWGIESKFFWNGLNPMYPAWYEINMAFNDITVALLAIYINNGLTWRW